MQMEDALRGNHASLPDRYTSDRFSSDNAATTAPSRTAGWLVDAIATRRLMRVIFKVHDALARGSICLKGERASRCPMASDDSLPAGVRIHPLKPHADERGVLTEIFRKEWAVGCDSVQWNVVHSTAGVLRGVHVHHQHDDYLVVISGVLILGLHDIRPDSRSAGWSHLVTLEAAAPRAVTIPPGVCHGFYFPVPSTLVYAVSAYWDPSDELGCRFDCVELGLKWPNETPLLSDRDRRAGAYRQMCEAFRERRRECRQGTTP